MSSDARYLLREISRCPNLKPAFAGAPAHPCSDILRSQNAADHAALQLPEPWNGSILNAPLLYLSSNPSISDVERYPTAGWGNDQVQDFFENRFGAHMKDGKCPRKKDASYRQATPYLAEILSRSRELFGRYPRPGKDYAITEIVHCKSRSMVGVKAAMGECKARYLHRVLSLSGATVIAVVGSTPAKIMRSELGIAPTERLFGPARIVGKDRLVLFLAAPGSNLPRVISKVFTAAEIGVIRGFLHSGQAPETARWNTTSPPY